MSKEEFEIRLDAIEMGSVRAKKSMRTLQHINASAREIAMQRNMNMMVEDMIAQLEMETNITVACSREERIGQVPCPPLLNRTQTLINFNNGR